MAVIPLQSIRFSEDGEIRLKEFNFMYLFRELGIILAVTEDITELSGTDMLTGGTTDGIHP